MALCLALLGCDGRGPPLASYQHTRDAMASLLPWGFLNIYPCASVEKMDGFDAIVSIPTDQCYKMQPPKRFQGVWVDEFEGSGFYEGISRAADAKARYARDLRIKSPTMEWLSWKAKSPVPAIQQSRMFLVDFVGRRTAYKGLYGHMGLAQTEIIVDRLISSHEIYRSAEPYYENELPDLN